MANLEHADKENQHKSS